MVCVQPRNDIGLEVVKLVADFKNSLHKCMVILFLLALYHG